MYHSRLFFSRIFPFSSLPSISSCLFLLLQLSLLITSHFYIVWCLWFLHVLIPYSFWLSLLKVLVCLYISGQFLLHMDYYLPMVTSFSLCCLRHFHHLLQQVLHSHYLHGQYESRCKAATCLNYSKYEKKKKIKKLQKITASSRKNIFATFLIQKFKVFWSKCGRLQHQDYYIFI